MTNYFVEQVDRLAEYELSAELGDGAYGTVLLARAKKNSTTVAVKRMKNIYLSWKDALKEMEIVVAAEVKRHPNIIHMIEAFRESQQLYMVFEYMECNLYQLMKERAMKRFTDVEVRSISGQILCGLQYLHEKGFFHRDLKPENILCNGTQVIKLADFGQARFIRSRPPYTEYVSTRWYRAPELVLSAKVYSMGVDIWAVGCIMAEIIMLRPLFDGATAADQLFKIVRVLGTPKKEEWSQGYDLAEKINMAFPQGFIRQNLSHIVKPCGQSCIDVIANTLHYNPQKRPTAKACWQMDFFIKQGTATVPNGKAWELAERVNKLSNAVDQRRNVPPLRSRLTEPYLPKLADHESHAKPAAIPVISPVSNSGAADLKTDSDAGIVSSAATLPVIPMQRSSLPGQMPAPVTHPLTKLPTTTTNKVRPNGRASGGDALSLLPAKLNLNGQKRFPLELNTRNNGMHRGKEDKLVPKFSRQSSVANMAVKPPLNLRLPAKNGLEGSRMPPPLLLNLSKKRSSSPQFAASVIAEDDHDLFPESKPNVTGPQLRHQLSTVERSSWLKPKNDSVLLAKVSAGFKPTLGFTAQNSSLSLGRPQFYSSHKPIYDKKSLESSWWEK